MPAEIIPYIGFGSIKLSAPRDEILSQLGQPTRSFRRSQSSERLTDRFRDQGLMLEYDLNNLLALIEIVPPAEPSFKEKLFLSRPITDALADMSVIGHSSRFDGDSGYYFDDLGFVLYVPLHNVEAVSVYRRGYYEEQDE